MGHIRAFVDSDIPQVARLHGVVFRTTDRTDREGPDPYDAYFRRVFLDNPSRVDALPSLVYQDDDGRVVGFLGVVPRRMSMGGQQLQAALSSQFVVDPKSRSALVAVQLAKTFLDGPQDLSISDEANDVARKIWEGLGGSTALLRSMYWTRPLRPARLALSFLRNCTSLAALAAVADPPSRIVDALATRLPRSHLFQARPALMADELRSETFLARLPEFAAGSLRVEYDDRMFQWLLERAGQRRVGGTLYKAVIKNHAIVVGWYLYHLDASRNAEVLQIAAKPFSIRDVLDHLFYDAWRKGATAVTGRLEPRFLQAFSDKYCLFHRRGPWMLVNARKPELLRAFHNGDAFFSRFDGEWCLGFRS
jgi:Acetyltransferase (GNAT) domain